MESVVGKVLFKRHIFYLILRFLSLDDTHIYRRLHCAGFTLKTHQMFSVHITLERFKKSAIPGGFEFAFQGYHMHGFRSRVVFEELCF